MLVGLVYIDMSKIIAIIRNETSLGYITGYCFHFYFKQHNKLPNILKLHFNLKREILYIAFLPAYPFVDFLMRKD